MKMLVVDMDESISQGLAKALATWENQIDVSAGEWQAWEALRAGDYDVLIAQDHMLAEASPDMLQFLRVAHPHMAIVRLLNDGILRPVTSAPDEVVTLAKPFSLPQLVDAIDDAHRLARGVPASHWEATYEPPLEDSYRHWGLNE